MENLNQQLEQFLSDPNSMKQLQSMLGSLGLGSNQEGGQSAQGSQPAQPASPPPAPPLDLSALTRALSALGGSGQSQGSAQSAQPALTGNPAAGLGALAGADSLAMVAKLAPLLSQLNREDDSTRLLQALRPMLSEARRAKIDEAVRILQLMRLLPMLKELGGLPGLF